MKKLLKPKRHHLTNQIIQTKEIIIPEPEPKRKRKTKRRNLSSKTKTNNSVPNEDKKANPNLKVIAFKLSRNTITWIKASVKVRQTHASLSELCRIAIMDLIAHCIRIQKEEINDFEVKDAIKGMELSYQDSLKDSACAKFPVTLLDVTDKIILEFQHLFDTRTKFVRTAIWMFMQKEEQIYNYWLNQ